MGDWVGLTVGQVLALCEADYRDVQFIDEPPGKLRAVEFNCRHGGGQRRVRLEIQYDPELFSRRRSWERSVVEGRKVLKAHDPAP